MLDPDETPFDAMWNVNAKGPMRAIRAAWPHLVASGTGRVVNIASLSGKRVRNDNLGYAMSKFAVMVLRQEVRRAGWEHGIRATAVCPGFVDTDMTAHVTKWPREKMSRPEDLAVLIEAVLHLANTASVAELLVNCSHEDML
jgi:NAD(P)-dependent dehydrogenase (short-subunit alcohol dehydrogenase family)